MGKITNALTGKETQSDMEGNWIEIPEYNRGEIIGSRLIRDKDKK